MDRSLLKLVINLIVFLCLLWCYPSYASIGSITDMKGGGQIKRGTTTVVANKNSGIEKMDTVATNSQGKIHIVFVDQTIVNITENSRLIIDDFVYDSHNTSKGKLGLKVALGTVRYASGGLAHGNPGGVNIRTPTATIAVRGTDFVMSVDEVGRSTVVLVPNCFDDNDITKIDYNCPSGAIDVMTDSGVVTMNKPFQATVVENAFSPPSSPVIIKPALKSMNNTIQIVPLTTDDGESLIKIARELVKKFVNPSEDSLDNNKDPNVGINGNIEQIAALLQPSEATPTQDEQVYVQINGSLPKQTVYTNVSPTFIKQVQEGWVYARMSDDKNQIVAIWVNKNTDAQIVSSQDGIVDSYDFVNAKWPTSGTGHPSGTITVIQNGSSK